MTSGPADDPDAELDRLAETYVRALRQGRAQDVEEVAAAHPALAPRIRRLFPLLGAMDAPLAAGAAVALPSRLGPYRIVREVGSGGMGRVFEAVADAGAVVTEGTRVAVKVVHPHLAADAVSLARFLREAEIGRRVAHPNVVRTLDAGVVAGEAGDAPYLVLEFVEGQTLRALLDELGPVPERLARLVALEVARGLAAFHAAGAVHRDVKPENLIVTPDESVRLMDLGVAAFVDHALRVSLTGQFVGTLLYAAPEQIERGEADARADLYALGLVLFELVAGRHPARAPNDRSATVEPSLAPLPPAVSPFFAAVIRTLLARDPARRFGSAAELASVLAEAERSAWWGSRQAASPPGFWERRRQGAPEFRGREAELAALDAAVDPAGDDGAVVVLVEGEPGVGKSRIAREWVARRLAREPGLAVVFADYAPRADAGSALAVGVRERLGEAGLGEPLAARLGPAAGTAPAFAKALRGEASDLGVEAFNAGVVRVLGSLAAESGLVVVAEDVHDAGPGDLALLLRAARALRGVRAVFLVLSRPLAPGHPVLDLLGTDRTLRMRLEGLDPAPAAALARDALGTAAGRVAPAALARAAGGNPLFLLELARAARRAPHADASATPPGTVRDLLTARLATLDRDTRELLEAAACAGQRFDPGLVAQAVGAPTIAALKRFARADRENDLLRAEGRDFRFRHPLVREALVEGLAPSLREAYAAALGDALEARDVRGAGLAADAVPESLGRTLVLLFLAGGRTDRARPYLGRVFDMLARHARFSELTALVAAAGGVDALRRALTGADLARALLGAAGAAVWGTEPEEALACLHEAREIADRAGATDVSIEADLQLAWTRSVLGRHDEARMSYETATARAAARNDRHVESLARGGLTNALFHLGRIDEALAEGRRALALSGGGAPTESEFLARTNLAVAALRGGRAEEAEDVLSDGLARARAAGMRDAECGLGIVAALARAGRADFQGAVDGLSEAADVAHEVGRPDQECAATFHAVRFLLETGRVVEAAERHAAGCALVERLHTPNGTMVADSLGVMLHLARGELAEAESGAEAGLRRAEEAGQAGALVTALLILAAIRIDLADAQGGRVALDRATEVVSAFDARGDEPALAFLRARLADLEGAPAERARTWEEAVRTARRPGGAARLGGALLGRGRAHAEAGDAVSARRDLEEAAAWAREADVPGVAACALARLASLDRSFVPAARAAVEAAADRAPPAARREARLVLGEATGDEALLAAALADLAAWLAAAPPAARDRMSAHPPRPRSSAHDAVTRAGP